MRGVLVAGGEHVPVGDEEEALVLILQLDPVTQRAMPVAEVQRAGRTHAGKDAPRRRGRTHVRAMAEWLTAADYSARPVIGPSAPLPLRTMGGGVNHMANTVVGRVPQEQPSSAD